MILDSALERIEEARGHMDVGDTAEQDRTLRAAVYMVTELRSSLDLQGGPWAINMGDVCDYVCRRLMSANVQGHLATLDEISHLLGEVRSAWGMLHV